MRERMDPVDDELEAHLAAHRRATRGVYVGLTICVPAVAWLAWTSMMGGHTAEYYGAGALLVVGLAVAGYGGYLARALANRAG